METYPKNNTSARAATWNTPIFPKSQAPKKTDCLTDEVIYSIVKMIELEITSELAWSMQQTRQI